MKRRWWWITLGVIAALGLCVLAADLVVKSFFDGIPCASETAFRDMNSVLQYALSDKVFNEPKDSTPYRMWMDLHQWLSDAQGRYDLVLLSLDQGYIQGDSAAVGARLSTGVNIVCEFYHGMVQSCDQVEEFLLPSQRVLDDMQSAINSIRENPSGAQLKLDRPLGISKSAQTSLQQWVFQVNGDLRFDQPVPEDNQCMFLDYSVQMRSVNGKAIECKFRERFIESCESVKE
jgi:hypothetical protein